MRAPRRLSMGVVLYRGREPRRQQPRPAPPASHEASAPSSDRVVSVPVPPSAGAAPETRRSRPDRLSPRAPHPLSVPSFRRCYTLTPTRYPAADIFRRPNPRRRAPRVFNHGMFVRIVSREI